MNLRSKLYVNLLKPLINRLGTAAATLLVTSGASEDAATQFVTAIVALILIALDLVLSWRDRKEN